MNPRLVKFAVELQNEARVEKQNETISFKSNCFKNFFDFAKLVKVTVPVQK